MCTVFVSAPCKAANIDIERMATQTYQPRTSKTRPISDRRHVHNRSHTHKPPMCECARPEDTLWLEYLRKNIRDWSHVPRTPSTPTARVRSYRFATPSTFSRTPNITSFSRVHAVVVFSVVFFLCVPAFVRECCAQYPHTLRVPICAFYFSFLSKSRTHQPPPPSKRCGFMLSNLFQSFPSLLISLRVCALYRISVTFSCFFLHTHRLELPGVNKAILLSEKIVRNDGYAYFGTNLQEGQCGVTIKNVKPQNNGDIKCFLGTSDGEEATGVIPLTVACKCWTGAAEMSIRLPHLWADVFNNW